MEKPQECLRPRPTPSHWREEGNKIFDNLEEADLIEKLDFSEVILSPTFHVPKPSDILTPHLVIDYSHINDLIIWPGQVMPLCDEVMRKIGEGNKYFLALDFSSSYWQILISKESRPVTAFVTERGKFVWNVLPQGLRSSSD